VNGIKQKHNRQRTEYKRCRQPNSDYVN